VSRPDIIARYFKLSNLVDVHNQLRQSELALEEMWLTKDPWFRIATTLYGMTITDAFLLAKYHATSNSEVQKMSIREFALRVSYDMWHRKIDDEPRHDILGDDLLDLPNAANASSGAQQQNTAHPLEWYDVMDSHTFGLTTQRGGDGKPCRRACSIKADKNCETIQHNRPTSQECQHQACMLIKNAAKNVHGITTGVFVCKNVACRKEHWNRVATQARL
jgi:hypothetical protein